MASAARIHMAEHGRDPRRYRMVAFGGAGPVHACRVAGLLGIEEIVLPHYAGVASAVGMLAARRGVENSRSFTVPLDAPDWAAIDLTLRELEAEGRRQLAEAGVEPDAVELELAADVRYLGQGHEVTVAVDPEAVARRDPAALRDPFLAEYRRRFGRSLDRMPVEVVSWRLRASAPPALESPDVETRVSGGDRRAASRSRHAFFREAGGFVETPVLRRDELAVDRPVEGPALVEEANTTMVVAPGWTAAVLPSGHVALRRQAR
jgi:N-methylhydantoinase A/oxoprolinase/acetone carboxylase beta subunit